jgi:cell division septum initiation protein DivIVA
MVDQPDGVDAATAPGVEDLLDELDRILGEARAMPLSASVMVNRGEVVALLQELRRLLPEELAQARWVVRSRDEILEHARTDAEQILADARDERDELVSQEGVVRAAAEAAERIREAAEETARRMRLEAEDYVDAKLANFEVVLNRTLTAVERGRERLRGRLEVDDLATVGLDAAGDGDDRD